jgi:ATP-dependent Clp protease ATP-binding subunit ClpC
MFERFTDRARRIVVLAQEEARMLNHNYIGTEHILLGLAHEGESVAARALESLGISLETVRRDVEEIIGQGQSAPPGHIPFTPRAKKVLELSLREALQLGHSYIGPEHLLLGLVREGEGVAAQVLQKRGAELNRVRQEVLDLLSASPGTKTADVVHDVPLCPTCRAPVKESIAYGLLDVVPPEEAEGRPVPFVFCLRCGTWLGTIPPA